MPFPFIYVCNLLEVLHPLHVRDSHLLPKLLLKQSIDTTNKWLKKHKNELNSFNTQSDTALWMLRPDKLVDRDYGITAQTLQLIIARIYRLSIADMEKLRRWETQPHLGDLAVCVHEVREDMTGTLVPSKNTRVTVEEIQNILLQIASKQPGSSPSVRSLSEGPVDPIRLLTCIYTRLDGREAKWLTRFILKDYGAILLPDSWPCESGLFGLPNCAPIVMDIFTKEPPVEILDGTRRVKATAESRASEKMRRVESEGWGKRPLRSRETSPISRPTKSFRKNISIPKMGISIPEVNITRSRDSSPDSSAPLTWARGILKPNPKRKRSEMASTPAELPVKTLSKPITKDAEASSMSQRENMAMGIYATPTSIRPPSRNLAQMDPKAITPMLTAPDVLISPRILSEVFKQPSTARRLSIQAENSKPSTKTRIYIDLTDSPPRSGPSTTTLIAPNPNKTPTLSRTTSSNVVSAARTLGSRAFKASAPSSSKISDASNAPTLASSNLIKIPSLSSGLTNVFSTTTLEASSSKGKAPTPRTALSDVSFTSALRNQISSRPSGQEANSKYLSSNPLIQTGTGSCQMTNSECRLIRCIVLLSPSLAENPHLVNEYLPWHGLQYIANLKALANPHLPSCCPKTKLRYRKIVLVDMHNRKETVDFLGQIEDLNLKHRVKRGKRDGRGNVWAKEYVEVYDWKLLEAIAKIDLGKQLDYDPWQRHFVGPI